MMENQLSISYQSISSFLHSYLCPFIIFSRKVRQNSKDVRSRILYTLVPWYLSTLVPWYFGTLVRLIMAG